MLKGILCTVALLALVLPTADAIGAPFIGSPVLGTARSAILLVAGEVDPQAFVGKVLKGKWSTPTRPGWGSTPSQVRINSISNTAANVSYWFGDEGESLYEADWVSARGDVLSWRYLNGARTILELGADGTISAAYFDQDGIKSVCTYK